MLIVNKCRNKNNEGLIAGAMILFTQNLLLPVVRTTSQLGVFLSS